MESEMDHSILSVKQALENTKVNVVSVSWRQVKPVHWKQHEHQEEKKTKPY